MVRLGSLREISWMGLVLEEKGVSLCLVLKKKGSFIGFGS